MMRNTRMIPSSIHPTPTLSSSPLKLLALLRIVSMVVMVVVCVPVNTCHAFVVSRPGVSHTISIERSNSYSNSNSKSKSNNRIHKARFNPTIVFSTKPLKSIVVVSPPGGVGEVTVVKAASLGAAVKWFLVSSSSSSSSTDTGSTATKTATATFSQDSMLEIQNAGGVVEFAGATDTVLLQEQDALAAVGTWCQTHVDGLVCCFDGTDLVNDEDSDDNSDDATKKRNGKLATSIWKDAIKVAAREASRNIQGCKLAILSEADDDDDLETSAAQQGGGLLDGLFAGKSTTTIPKSLSAAIQATSKLRHGTLFGTPESSPTFSTLVGGPQKNPILCEEYQMRNVRLDPSLAGTVRKEAQSCRHVVGEAAALMVTETISPVPKDVSITSLRGVDKFELWTEEFDRVVEMERQGQGAVLFSAAFSSVPSIDRLSSWIATKWAPAVMRTYDIAAIRTGARPVFANQVQENLVEIVWQELVNFETVTVGKLLVRISNDGIVATRGPGDASKGFGNISRKPLNGEATLVQRLADAASQAIEKGLANKPAATKTVKVPSTSKKAEPQIVSSLQSAQTITTPVVDVSSGPRQSGARRSSEKVRGKRTRRTSSDENDSSSESEPGSFE